MQSVCNVHVRKTYEHSMFALWEVNHLVANCTVYKDYRNRWVCLQMRVLLGKAFETVGIDVVRPLLRSNTRMIYLVVATDHLTH